MEQLINGSWIIAGSMKASGDSPQSKTFRLKVHFKNVPVQDVVAKALEPTKIAWVNGQGRPNFSKWTENQLIEIDFRAPARAPVQDPKEAMIARLASMTPEEMKAELQSMMDAASKTVK